MSGKLVWERDGVDWPNREASRFINAAGLAWHVQMMGRGPVALLLHGTGASTHSWAGLAPLLAENWTVAAPDLPGHGFTDMPRSGGLSLPGMAALVTRLVRTLEISPGLAIGHSAGAAVLIRMALDGAIAPSAIVSLNGALLPFGGMAAPILAPLARIMFLNPLAPRYFAWRAKGRRTVERVIRGTGSNVSEAYIDHYARLFRSPVHVAAALGMMANWDLPSLARDLPRLKTPLVLVAGTADAAVSPEQAFRVRDLAPHASVELARGLGHLAHEEAPGMIAGIIRRAGRDPARGRFEWRP